MLMVSFFFFIDKILKTVIFTKHVISSIKHTYNEIKISINIKNDIGSKSVCSLGMLHQILSDMTCVYNYLYLFDHVFTMGPSPYNTE